MEGIRDIWDNIKFTNICIIGVPEEEREKRQKKLCEEIMAEIFLNLVMKIDIQAQEAERVPNMINTKKSTPRCIIIKMSKLKEKNLKSRKRKKKLHPREPP